jgi:hypothetical protein
MWSKELIKLSLEYFNYDNTSVKSQTGDFGILNIDYENKIWTITLLTENKRDLNLTFYSVEDIIKAGWAVD